MRKALGKKKKGFDWQEYYHNLGLLYYRYLQDTHQEITLDTPAMRIKHFGMFRATDIQNSKKGTKK